MPAGTVPAGWSELPASPLSARRDARAVSVGSRAYLFGGWAAEPCPNGPFGVCVSPGALVDGASFDVETGTWRRMANAPGEIGHGGAAVVGSTIYVETDGDQSLMAYDTATDAWTDVPEPKGLEGRFYPYELVSAGGRLLTCYGGSEGFRDQVYDEGSRTWSELPADPLGKVLTRSCAGAEDRFVVLGAELRQLPQPEDRLPARAAVLDVGAGTWTRLPDATDLSTLPGWTWDGKELVHADLEPPYGGPLPGGGRLDPVSGEWSQLPDPPHAAKGLLLTASSERFKATRGRDVYDTRVARWTTIPEPPGSVSAHPSQVWVGDRLLAWGGGTLSRGKGPADTVLSSTGALYQLRSSRLRDPEPAAPAPQPTATAGTTCPGTQPCRYDLQVGSVLTLDGRVIRGRTNALDGSRSHELELRLTTEPGVTISRYWFGESSGGYGFGPEGPTGIRLLRTGDGFASGSTLRLTWRPALTGHRYLVALVQLEAPGWQGSELGLTVGELQIS